MVSIYTYLSRHGLQLFKQEPNLGNLRSVWCSVSGLGSHLCMRNVVCNPALYRQVLAPGLQRSSGVSTGVGLLHTNLFMETGYQLWHLVADTFPIAVHKEFGTGLAYCCHDFCPQLDVVFDEQIHVVDE